MSLLLTVVAELVLEVVLARNDELGYARGSAVDAGSARPNSWHTRLTTAHGASSHNKPEDATVA